MSRTIDRNGRMRAYDGSGEFVFVNYAHKDSDEVLPIIDYLLSRGYNIWFDGGA